MSSNYCDIRLWFRSKKIYIELLFLFFWDILLFIYNIAHCRYACFKPACENRSDQKIFIQTNSFYWLGTDPKKWYFGIDIERSTQLIDNGYRAATFMIMLHHNGPLLNSAVHAIHYCFGGSGVVCSCLPWNGCGFLVSLGKKVVVMVVVDSNSRG